MTDRELSMNCAVAWTLWVLSGLILIFSIALWDDLLARHLGRIAMFMCGAAIAATVRSYFVTTNRIVRSVLAVRDSVDDVPMRSVR